MHRGVMKFNLALAVFGLGLAVMPMFGHHSVEGQYDTGGNEHFPLLSEEGWPRHQ